MRLRLVRTEEHPNYIDGVFLAGLDSLRYAVRLNGAGELHAAFLPELTISTSLQLERWPRLMEDHER